MSEEQKQPKKRNVTELKYPLPDVRVSLDSQFDIIAAYVVASNNGKNHVGYKELAPYIKVDSTMVSGCNKFFQHLGLIKPSEKSGKYVSTKLANELHNARKWKNDELLKTTLQKILETSWFWNQTKQYLEVNESTTKNELTQKLGLACGADPQKHRRALDKLIEYLQNAELILEDNGNFKLNTSITEKPTKKIDIDQSKDLLQVSIGDETYAIDVDKIKDFVLSNGKKISDTTQKLE